MSIETSIFPHVKNGFFCDDRSISLKYQGDTISTGFILLSITFAFPILWICEAIFFKPVSLKSSRFKGSAGNAWMWFKEYILGMILHLFIVDACKVSWRCTIWSLIKRKKKHTQFDGKQKLIEFGCLFKVLFGELRPHFLDSCRPEGLDTCTPG